MNADEYSEVENRFYINPQKGLDETNEFIENFRSAQQSEKDRISSETRALGSDVPIGMGGLAGGNGVWQKRYATPQIDKMVEDLKATAQAQAFSEAMQNELSQAKERYNQAKRAYNKRQRTPTTTTPDTTISEPDVEVTGYTPIGKLSDWNVNKSGVPRTLQLIVDGEVQLSNQDGTPYVDNQQPKELTNEEKKQILKDAVDKEYKGVEDSWMKHIPSIFGK